ARAAVRRRVVAAVTLLGCGAALDQLGPSSDIVFGHLHNFGAVAFWWAWRARRGRAHWVPLVLLLAASCLLLSSIGVEWVGSKFEWHATGDSADRQLWRLAPGLAPMLGMRLVLLFCFMQSVHYAMWLQMIPDEERRRSTVMTFRASLRDLERDFDRVALLVLAVLAVGLLLWASFDMLAADRGYFRMARFHGTLEVMAAVLLVLERVGVSPVPAGPAGAGARNSPTSAQGCDEVGELVTGLTGVLVGLGGPTHETDVSVL
ncbi:MAG: hypothetical protein KUG77_10805, partial [Nannocystaceae bacterium]|nr:hypothetical protein [Nannocystaceae bacterium]